MCKYLAVIRDRFGPDTQEQEIKIEVKVDNIRQAFMSIEERMKYGEVIISIERVE